MVDTISENGLRLVLSTNSRPPLTDTFVFSKEVPPKECLGEPYINEKARDMLTEPMKWLASKENLLSLAMMTVSEGAGENRILTQKASGRTTVVRHGQIEFADNVGGIILEKGGWLSGDRFDDKEIISDSVYTPWGLYGSKESLGDIKLSNALIEDGFKSALSLGFIPLNSDKTRVWLLEKFKEDKIIQGIVDTSFSIVKKNGDIPVLDFRVGGVEYRIKEAQYSFSKADRAIQKGFLAHSAKLLKEEITKYPKRYLKNLSDPGKIDNCLLVLDKVGKRVFLDKSEFYLYKDMYDAIGRNNTVALEKFLKRRKSLNIGLPDNFARYLSDPKDVCFAGFTYDFEQTGMCEFEDDGLFNLDKENSALTSFSDGWETTIHDWFFEGVNKCVCG